MVIVYHPIGAADRTVVRFTYSFTHALGFSILIYSTVTSLLAHFPFARICIEEERNQEKRWSMLNYFDLTHMRTYYSREWAFPVNCALARSKDDRGGRIFRLFDKVEPWFPDLFIYLLFIYLFIFLFFSFFFFFFFFFLFLSSQGLLGWKSRPPGEPNWRRKS